MNYNKDYQTVASRLDGFRADHPTYGVETDWLHFDTDWCMCKISIKDEQGRIISQGTAREVKNDIKKYVNATSFVENCETSALGRALAFLGYKSKSVATTEDIEIAKAKRAVLDECNKRLDELNKLQTTEEKRTAFSNILKYAKEQGLPVKFSNNKFELL